MRCEIASPLSETVAGATAEAVLRACVHCGMCNATCPTYQLTGDELDGPRGRIYLIKQVLEGEAPSRLTQVHLDRCLSCRACETTCPSGVEYHRLYDIGVEAVARQTRRPLVERLTRGAIRWACMQPERLQLFVALARPFSAMAPKPWRAKLNTFQKSRGEASREPDSDPLFRRMSLMRGCVQAAATPRTNAAARRVFAAAGIGLEETAAAGCCGALAFHTGAFDEARRLARRNIDAWAADLQAGSEGVVVTASGCAAFVRDYADLLAEDPEYADAATRIAKAVRDPAEVLAAAPLSARRAPEQPRIAIHDPCTLRNGPGLAGTPAAVLARLGFDPQPVAEAHLCCGSAGAWSLLHGAMAGKLREAKISALTAASPQAIYTANVGCQLHLAETSPVPVRHWLEAVDEVL